MSTDTRCCYKCTDRVIGCHANCKKYKEYLDDLQNKKNELKAYREVDAPYDNYMRAKYKKMKWYKEFIKRNKER